MALSASAREAQQVFCCPKSLIRPLGSRIRLKQTMDVVDSETAAGRQRAEGVAATGGLRQLRSRCAVRVFW